MPSPPMPEHDWEIVITKLLEWFDTMEGTTYLYTEREKESFLQTLNISNPEKVRDLLNTYHNKKMPPNV